MSTLALAIDLGGTKVESALVDESGQLVPGSRARAITGSGTSLDLLTAALTEAIGATLRVTPHLGVIAGIGIGSAGPVDVEADTVSPVNMPQLVDAPLARIAAAAARDCGAGDLRATLRHDGGCLALAEAWVGAARNARASLSIVVSTGIGGGFVLDGASFSGASGNAGHLGQTHVAAGDLTLEEVASGPASVAWANAQGWTGSTGEDLARDARTGDATARAAIVRSAEAVGFALADAATLLDLDVVAVGGGFSRSAADYVELVGAALRERAALPYSRATRVVPSALGDEGPLIGAAALIVGPRGTPVRTGPQPVVSG